MAAKARFCSCSCVRLISLFKENETYFTYFLTFFFYLIIGSGWYHTSYGWIEPPGMLLIYHMERYTYLETIRPRIPHISSSKRFCNAWDVHCVVSDSVVGKIIFTIRWIKYSFVLQIGLSINLLGRVVQLLYWWVIIRGVTTHSCKIFILMTNKKENNSFFFLFPCGT